MENVFQDVYKRQVYDELSEEDKEAYEDTFEKEGELPEAIGASALNTWVFNEDTIRPVSYTHLR